MIRRDMGDSFFLFAQDDHARLSGQLAKHYGNRLFAKPDPLEQTIRAVARHDCGWPLHDERPTLNKDGLPLDVPLRLGLAVRTDLAEEEKLRRNHNIVQTMDRISLGLCCTELVFEKIEGIVPRPGAAAVTLRFIRTDDFALRVEPWPFDQERIDLGMAYRAVAAGKYDDVEEFRSAYAKAEQMRTKMTVHH